MMLFQTPLDASQVLIWCNKIVPGNHPIFLKVEPSYDALPAECFKNVERMIAREGGEKVLGWNVFVCPRVAIEFEFHCIWKDLRGNLRDVTPRPDGERVVLFLPDNTRNDTGEIVDNLRFSLCVSAKVDRWIMLGEHRVMLKRKYFRGAQGDLAWSKEDMANYRSMMIEGSHIIESLYRLQRNDPCLCGSRKKAKKCCAARL